MNLWQRVTKFDRHAVALADRHYSRRRVGAPQFMPPGQTVVLLSPDRLAVFGWWRPDPAAGIRSMNGLDGWTCTIFRNESDTLSSDLILAAEDALRLAAEGCGPDGLITYVWDSKVRSTHPGYCFLRAGWSRSGRSAGWKENAAPKAMGPMMRRRPRISVWLGGRREDVARHAGPPGPRHVHAQTPGVALCWPLAGVSSGPGDGEAAPVLSYSSLAFALVCIGSALSIVGAVIGMLGASGYLK